MTSKPPFVVSRRHPFRRAVFRGLGVVLPPLLTIVIFLWVGSTVQRYVFEPVTAGARNALARYMDGQTPPRLEGDRATVDGRTYVRLANETYVPLHVYETVRRHGLGERMPNTSLGYHQRYVDVQYLQPYVVIPVLLVVFLLVLYLLGKFLAAGIGRVFWNLLERMIVQLPLVRNVYSSVKQVTDFMFNESEIQYTRVVAVEYPRKGIWSLGLVTSESLADIRDAAGEPVLALLIPSSPMPVTGYTITVRKSEAVDLDITIDQAFQFIVSCGVVVPPQQLAAQAYGSGSSADPPTASGKAGAVSRG